MFLHLIFWVLSFFSLSFTWVFPQLFNELGLYFKVGKEASFYFILLFDRKSISSEVWWRNVLFCLDMSSYSVVKCWGDNALEQTNYRYKTVLLSFYHGCDQGWEFFLTHIKSNFEIKRQVYEIKSQDYKEKLKFWGNKIIYLR